MVAYARRSAQMMQALAVCVLAACLTCATARGQIPADGSIFVDLLIQKRELYVGESVPVTIQVGAQDDVVASLDSPPSLRGDAFTLNVLLGEPDREQRVINGQSCTILSWHSLLAAVKPGTLSLTIEAPLTVRVPVTQRPEASFVDDSTGDPYQDPASQTLLQSTTAQAVVVSSRAMEFHVLPLPVHDRPAGFSGAVGNFEISSELSKNRSVVGEPLSLRMHIRGSGNFDRVNSAMLGTAEHWKVYRPTATFATAEKTGFRGEKLFEQAIVATRPGSRSLPALEFSYFDPDSRRYTIARAPPLSIEVAPGPASAAEPVSTDISGSDAHLRADHATAAGVRDSLLPLYLQAPFLSVPVLLLAALTRVWFKRTQRASADIEQPPGLTEIATQELLREMELAADSGDVDKFIRAARVALQRAKVGEDDAEGHEMLRLLNEVDYAGASPDCGALQRCRQHVLRRLNGADLNPAAPPA